MPHCLSCGKLADTLTPLTLAWMECPECAKRRTDEVAAQQQYRRAQWARIRRYCTELGVDPRDAVAGRIEIDWAPICDEHGEIVPEPIEDPGTTTT